jgi:hypothetical protein
VFSSDENKQQILGYLKQTVVRKNNKLTIPTQLLSPINDEKKNEKKIYNFFKVNFFEFLNNFFLR